MSAVATVLWRGLTVGLVVPARAFGAAVDIDGLLIEPDLHFAATPTTSRLMLMPRAGAFSRLLLEWETLPEIGVFTASAWGPAPFADTELARLETWMRDVAVTLHSTRDRIREASERAVHDASSGLDTSLPTTVPEGAHVVSAVVGTRVSGPHPDAPFGVVDVSPARATGPESGEMLFTQRSTGRLLGRRITTRDGDEIASARFEPAVDASDTSADGTSAHGTSADGARAATEADLAEWYEQHIFREVLFDDVWQVYVHLAAGLEPPVSVLYTAFGG
ncbi:hypothetical protein AX769_19525 [Frondihabitans sp. PAMC 28766]|uniref:hypothetical protein n=1 Tax=Frondihabitans sp. PAMC 28766 TaxID=1795630 RepID=UPI00078C9657|nr:hypothetical protein [Frondihabitans sp. PAMC 28766]AMM21932.1 hypothetical protein AX769_19525 [Frondihabitans sp. PAMC 28766]